MATFFEGHSYVIGSKYDPDTAQINLYSTGYEGAPLVEWGLRTGDCLHNLRSALDHVAWQFALDHLGREPNEREARSIQFPLEETCKGFKEARIRPFISTTHLGWINHFQPYHRGDRAARHKLAILARLNNIDKHRVVHAAAVVPEGFEFEFGEPQDVSSYGALEIYFGKPLEKDAPIGRFCDVVASGPNPYINAEGPFEFSVVLDHPADPVIHEASIVKLLGQVGEIVDAVVSTAEATFELGLMPVPGAPPHAPLP